MVWEWAMGLFMERAFQAEEQSWGKGPVVAVCLGSGRKARRPVCGTEQVKGEPWARRHRNWMAQSLMGHAQDPCPPLHGMDAWFGSHYMMWCYRIVIPIIVVYRRINWDSQPKSPIFTAEKINTQRDEVTCSRPQSGQNGTGLGLGPLDSQSRAFSPHASTLEMNCPWRRWPWASLADSDIDHGVLNTVFSFRIFYVD